MHVSWHLMKLSIYSETLAFFQPLLNLVAEKILSQKCKTKYTREKIPKFLLAVIQLKITETK